MDFFQYIYSFKKINYILLLNKNIKNSQKKKTF